MQSRRDAEIVRVKKHFLKVYTEESASVLKRAAEEASYPSSKIRRVSVETWRAACQGASGTSDDSLPSFDDAMRLFGYAS